MEEEEGQSGAWKWPSETTGWPRFLQNISWTPTPLSNPNSATPAPSAPLTTTAAASSTLHPPKILLNPDPSAAFLSAHGSRASSGWRVGLGFLDALIWADVRAAKTPFALSAIGGEIWPGKAKKAIGRASALCRIVRTGNSLDLLRLPASISPLISFDANISVEISLDLVLLRKAHDLDRRRLVF